MNNHGVYCPVLGTFQQQKQIMCSNVGCITFLYYALSVFSGETRRPNTSKTASVLNEIETNTVKKEGYLTRQDS